MKANYERKPLEELNALADEEEMIDEALDDKDHPLAGAIGLREELTGGNIETNDETEEVTPRPGGEGRASMDYSVEADDDDDVDEADDVDKEYNSEEDLDKLLDEELDDLDIGRVQTQQGASCGVVDLMWLGLILLVVGFD